MEPPPLPPPTSAPTVALKDLIRSTSNEQLESPGFQQLSPDLVQLRVTSHAWSKSGAMVAYRGNLTFQRETLGQAGFGRALTGEINPLTCIQGDGLVLLAEAAKRITLVTLQEESIVVSAQSLLAFEASLQHQVIHNKVQGLITSVSWMTGIHLSGTGTFALATQGTPTTLPVTADFPAVSDPAATVAWSESLTPQRYLPTGPTMAIGPDGGEIVQAVFQGHGFIIVQPSETIAHISDIRRHSD